MSDEYRTVTVILRQSRASSIMVDHPRVRGWVSVPRSLIHGGDDRKLNSSVLDKEVTFRLMEWKAEQLGLAG